MNEQDKAIILDAIASLRKFFVNHQKGLQYLTHIEKIIKEEKTDDKNTDVSDVPTKKRGRKPRKKDDVTG